MFGLEATMTDEENTTLIPPHDGELGFGGGDCGADIERYI
jgi:hypothetical protein